MRALPVLVLSLPFLATACADHDPIAVTPGTSLHSRPAAPGSIIPGSLVFNSRRDHPNGDLYAMNPGGDRIVRLTYQAGIENFPD